MTKKSKSKRSKDAGKKLKGFGKDVVKSISRAKPPKLEIPLRSSSNIVYDPKKRYYKLAGKMGLRTAARVDQVKKMAQMLCAADFCNTLIDSGKSATLREMYYTAEGWETGAFGDQSESNLVVEDMEAAFGLKREDLGLTPEEDGASVYGKLVVNEGGVQIDATKSGRSGYTIPPSIDEVEFLKCDAKRVLAVETMGMYHRLVQENAWKKFNTLVVGLKGQAARATRRFLKRANEELKLPVYLFTDGDPYGFHIAMVIISGSAKLAYINHDLAVPDAQFIGVTASDIKEYDLPTDKLRNSDVERLKQLQKDPRYHGEHWQSEIELMMKLGKKAEQQAFSKYGLEYVVNDYLPAKLGV